MRSRKRALEPFSPGCSDRDTLWQSGSSHLAGLDPDGHCYKVVRTALAWVGICCTALAVPSAQTSSQSQQAQVVAVVGCLAQEGGGWQLTSATEPISAPAPGGGQSSVGVTVEIANKQPLGKGRYRLIGVLEEFGIPAHKGHKMLVKGLLIVEGAEKRINVTSATMAAVACRAPSP